MSYPFVKNALMVYIFVILGSKTRFLHVKIVSTLFANECNVKENLVYPKIRISI